MSELSADSFEEAMELSRDNPGVVVRHPTGSVVAGRATIRPEFIERLADTDEHSSAEDYRNRAERAEQEAAELREVAKEWRGVAEWLALRLQVHVKFGCTRARKVDQGALDHFNALMIR